MSEQTPGPSNSLSDDTGPSMEDILASIRKIIADDDVDPVALDSGPDASEEGRAEDDVDVDLGTQIEAGTDAQDETFDLDIIGNELIGNSSVDKQNVDTEIEGAPTESIRRDELDSELPSAENEATNTDETDDVLDLNVVVDEADFALEIAETESAVLEARPPETSSQVASSQDVSSDIGNDMLLDILNASEEYDSDGSKEASRDHVDPLVEPRSTETRETSNPLDGRGDVPAVFAALQDSPAQAPEHSDQEHSDQEHSDQEHSDQEHSDQEHSDQENSRQGLRQNPSQDLRQNPSQEDTPNQDNADDDLSIMLDGMLNASLLEASQDPKSVGDNNEPTREMEASDTDTEHDIEVGVTDFAENLMDDSFDTADADAASGSASAIHGANVENLPEASPAISEDIALVKSLMADLTDESLRGDNEPLKETTPETLSSETLSSEVSSSEALSSGEIGTDDVGGDILRAASLNNPLDLGEISAIAAADAIKAEKIANKAVDNQNVEAMPEALEHETGPIDTSMGSAPKTAGHDGETIGEDAPQMNEAEAENAPDFIFEEKDMPRAVNTPPIDNTMVEGVAEAASAKAFASLNKVVMEQNMVAERGDRIGDLVQDVMRPMIKEWLAENLEMIVERAVEREVKRIASNK